MISISRVCCKLVRLIDEIDDEVLGYDNILFTGVELKVTDQTRKYLKVFFERGVEFIIAEVPIEHCLENIASSELQEEIYVKQVKFLNSLKDNLPKKYNLSVDSNELLLLCEVIDYLHMPQSPEKSSLGDSETEAEIRLTEIAKKYLVAADAQHFMELMKAEEDDEDDEENFKMEHPIHGKEITRIECATKEEWELAAEAWRIEERNRRFPDVDFKKFGFS